NPEFEQLAADAFRTPQTIFGSQVLNQSDDFRRHRGTTSPRARFEFPKQARSLAVPTQQGLWFENEPTLLPIRAAAGQKDEPLTVGGREAGFRDLPVEDDQLLPDRA